MVFGFSGWFYQDVAGSRLVFYASQGFFGFTNFNKMVMLHIYLFYAGSCLRCVVMSVCWDTELCFVIPVFCFGMNYVQEIKNLFVGNGKDFMRGDFWLWFILRLLLVMYRLRSWYGHIEDFYISGFTRCRVKMRAAQETFVLEEWMGTSLAGWYFGFVTRMVYGRWLDKRDQMWILCFLTFAFQWLFLSSRDIGLRVVSWYIPRRQVRDQVLDILLILRGLWSVKDCWSLLLALLRDVVHMNGLSKLLAWICFTVSYKLGIACYKLGLVVIDGFLWYKFRGFFFGYGTFGVV